MKHLYIMRHAKSSWDSPGLSDFERPLNPRGKRDAPHMGDFLAEHDFMPELIVSSPAQRAKTTAELVADAAAFGGEMWLDERIYMADGDTLLDVVYGLPDSFQRVLLVGHNPGFEELVEELCGGLVRMPTATIACVHLDAPTWGEVEEGVLQWLVTPKLLL